MKFITNKLSSKLLLPIISSSVILVAVLITIIWHFQKVNRHYILEKEIAAFEALIDNNIARISNKGIYVASIMASLDTVRAIYMAYHSGADFNNLTQQMVQPIENVIKSVENNLNVSPRIHFHVPPAKSFYRSWTDERGDDLSGFRRGVEDVINSGNAVKGIEIGRGGFVVRGIVPIVNNGRVLGSVESYFSMKEVMNYSRLTEHEEIAIFMDTKMLEIATGFNNTTNINSGSQQIGNLILFDKTSDVFNLGALNPDTLNAALERKITFENNNYVYVLTPLKNYNGIAQGVGVIQIDMNDINTIFSSLTRTMVVISIIILLFLMVLITIVIRKMISKRIHKVKTALEKMSLGETTSILKLKSSDELGVMTKSLNRLIKRNKENATFANNIGSGNFEAEYKPLSESDIMGIALLEMRDSLTKAKEQEKKRNEENQQRTWTSQGVAMFSNILRTDNDNIEELTYKIISNLVQYTKSNQGGVFLINDRDSDDIFIEMVACYAYDRKKLLEKKYYPGEGLVGRCYLEKDKIFLTEIPEGYMKISSGMGEEDPKCLLLYPLVYNNAMVGIIEIASFSVYQDYQIEFMQTVGENIAATILSVRANLQSAELLEKTQQQAEEMRAQEEEMRQNMEELHATQEASQRQEEDLRRELDKAIKEIHKLKSGDN